MKKIIAGMIGAAMLGGAVVAQEVTFYNRMGSVLVEQAATKDADANFGKLYDRIVGQYDSEKFSFFGRFQADVVGWNEQLNGVEDKKGNAYKPWSDFIGLDAPIIEFNGAMRPLPFLELALGNSYGEELPWEGYELPGSYGYGSDVTYGRGEWADGNGGTVLFKGAGVGVDGLYVGWNFLPIQNVFKNKANEIDPRRELGWEPHEGDGWETQVGVIYNIDGMLGIGVGAKLSTRKGEESDGKDIDPNQQIGVYVEYTGVENLKIGAGATMDTNGMYGLAYRSHDSKEYHSFAKDQFGFLSGYMGDLYDVLGRGVVANQFGITAENERKLTTFVNVGAEYSFAGMGLPLLVAADAGLYAGKETVAVVKNGEDLTMMPMLVGALVRFDPMENLWLDLRAVYQDALVSGSLKGYDIGDIGRSQLTITPRVHFLLSESDEFRLQAPITTNWEGEFNARNNKFEKNSYTGFNIEIFWQHNF